MRFFINENAVKAEAFGAPARTIRGAFSEPPQPLTSPQWRGNYFWTGGQTGNTKLMGSFIEFGPRFCPKNKRSLKKNRSSDCVCRLPTAFVWLRIQFSGGKRKSPRGPKYFQGVQLPPPLLPAPMPTRCNWVLFVRSTVFFMYCFSINVIHWKAFLDNIYPVSMSLFCLSRSFVYLLCFCPN